MPCIPIRSPQSAVTSSAPQQHTCSVQTAHLSLIICHSTGFQYPCETPHGVTRVYINCFMCTPHLHDIKCRHPHHTWCRPLRLNVHRLSPLQGARRRRANIRRGTVPVLRGIHASPWISQMMQAYECPKGDIHFPYIHTHGHCTQSHSQTSRVQKKGS